MDKQKPVPRALRSLSPHRRILPPATKPTHFTYDEIRKLLRDAEAELIERESRKD